MIDSPILAAIFLLGSSLITGLSGSIQRIGKAQAESLANKGLAKFLFKKSKRDPLSYCITITKNVLLVCYTITAFGYAFFLLKDEITVDIFVLTALAILGAAFLSDYLFKALSLFRPRSFFKSTMQIASIFLLIMWLPSLLLFRILNLIRPPLKETHSIRIKDKILEILHDSEFAPYDPKSDDRLPSHVSEEGFDLSRYAS